MASSSSTPARGLQPLRIQNENGGSSRIPTFDANSTASPIGSDVGSIASVSTSRIGGSSRNKGRTLGNLHGAGLSTLQLALGEANGGGSSPSNAPKGFNAISTLLNDPKRPQRPIDPNSSRYPAISQSYSELPKVKRSDLESYITSTQKEWDRYQRNIRIGSNGKARVQDGESSRASLDERSMPSSDSADTNHLAAIGKKKLSPLSTIPQVFFAEDFDLGNPYTFDLVTERYKAAGTANSTRNGSALPGAGYDVALNQMLQEKLSYYSDVVEQHLILEISARSTSFFAALGNLQDLETEASHCLERVERLKAELDSQDELIAKAGLRVIREQAARREIEERLEAVGVLQALCERMDLCRLLIQNGEWSEALEVMELLRNVIDGQEKLPTSRTGSSALPPHVDLDLSSITSIKGMLPQLDAMLEAISSQLEAEIMLILKGDLEGRIGGPVISTSTGAEAAANDTTTALRERISIYLLGLVRTQSVDRFANVYREAALQATRKTLKTYICNSIQLQNDDRREDLASLLVDDEAASGKSDTRLSSGGAEAASRLKEMPHADAIELFRVIFRGLTKTIESVNMQTQIILQILSEAGKKEAGGDAVDITMPLGVSHSLPTFLSSLVADIGSLTHVLGSRIVSLRSSIHINLNLEDFLGIFHLCWNFILESEDVSKRMLVGFRGVILNQAKLWLSNFHRQRIEKAARAVEEENWNQSETNSEQQRKLTLIIDSATSDPKELLIGSSSTSTEDQRGQFQNSIEATSTSKTLQIEDRQFFVVGATLDVLDLLVDYLKVVINLPLLCTETMGRVVEFAKQFNSRTCQVVLGAGAMRSAGLKNITAKHLALASQSLSIMITLIPYIRETIRRHLSPTQAVMLIEFDKLKRDYQEHQNEIHSKLVAIMSDRLTVHCRSLGNLQWNEESGAANPVQPVADLTKEVITLHRVLFRFWHSSSAENVIGQVLKNTDIRIAAELQKVDVKTDAATQRMISAKDLFAEKFSTLKDVQWTSSEIESVIDDKKGALEKSKAEAAAAIAAASVPPPEKKEAIPAYKPRMNIFQRRTTQNMNATGQPASNRGSMDVAEPASPALDKPIPSEPIESLTSHEEESVMSPVVPAKDEVPDTPDKGSTIEIPTSVPASPRIDSPSQGTLKEEEGNTSMGDDSMTALSPPASRPETPIKPSTPTLRNTSIDGTSTPTRMTLQQRLAEAARKRAQGGAARGAGLRGTSSGIPTPLEQSIDSSTSIVPNVEADQRVKGPEISSIGDGPTDTVQAPSNERDAVVSTVEVINGREETSADPIVVAEVEVVGTEVKSHEIQNKDEDAEPAAAAIEKGDIDVPEVKVSAPETGTALEDDTADQHSLLAATSLQEKVEGDATESIEEANGSSIQPIEIEIGKEEKPIEDIEALPTDKVDLNEPEAIEPPKSHESPTAQVEVKEEGATVEG